jgi:hypothetical protein
VNIGSIVGHFPLPCKLINGFICALFKSCL